uniref:WH1 domain-containing protein n=1 Tax=Amphimedon queenslandica TaxID=400682 RepID=A0A1X7SZ92_AMPQE
MVGLNFASEEEAEEFRAAVESKITYARRATMKRKPPSEPKKPVNAVAPGPVANKDPYSLGGDDSDKGKVCKPKGGKKLTKADIGKATEFRVQNRRRLPCALRQRAGIERDDKLLTFSRKTRRRLNYCFLFSKHFLVTQRVEKKGEEGYRLLKENGLLSLAKCRIHEHALPEYPELRFLSFGLEIDDGSQSQSKQKLIFIAMSV